jgi:glycosyltransferase involved in cell wall biosynthesis
VVNAIKAADSAPLVSVIIPAYKVAPFIGETLNSVFAQDVNDFEVIVINDGSPDTDDLEVSLKPYADRITYLKQANRGAGAARNAGLRAARGTYVAFLDGDDVWFPTFLSEQIRFLTTGNGADLVYADLANFGKSDSAGPTYMALNPSKGKASFDALITSQCSVLTSTVLAKRDLILNVGLFDESIPNSQDFDLWVRLVKDANAKIDYHAKVLGRRRLHHGSLAADPLKSLTGEINVLKKISKRNDLSGSESVLIERVLTMREAAAHRMIGKRRLQVRDYAAAYNSFESANRVFKSWKLRLVMWGLRLAPNFTRLASKARPH